MPPRKRRSKANPIQTSASARRVQRDFQNDVHPNGPQIAGCRDSRFNFVASHLSPIRSLPVEVLGQIFILTMHIDFSVAAELHDTLRHSERRFQIFNPLVLCAVSSSWRSLAFATPRLWQRVLVQIPLRLEKAQAKKRATNFIQWIERARSLPLALHLTCDYHSPPDWTVCKAFLSVVNDYAARWESLYIQDSFTALQLGPSRTLPLTLFQNDTKLNSFWKDIMLFQCPHHLPIYENSPWAELTHLQLHIHHQNSPCNIFVESPNLVQLSISVASLFQCYQPFGSPMIHRNLVIFSLKMSRGSRYLLNHISLPSLRDMFIKQVSSKHIQPLLNFFTRSSCSLDKLEVHGQNLLPDDLLNVLAHRSCNSLTSLKILEPCDVVSPRRKRELGHDHVLRRLALHQDDSLCPHLKFLTIDCAAECSLSALLNLVESRVGQLPDEPIQYLHLRSIKHLNDVRKLDEVGKGSGMEYSRRRYREVQARQYFYSVWLQKQGLQRKQLLVNHGGFFLDLDQV